MPVAAAPRPALLPPAPLPHVSPAVSARPHSPLSKEAAQWICINKRQSESHNTGNQCVIASGVFHYLSLRAGSRPASCFQNFLSSAAASGGGVGGTVARLHPGESSASLGRCKARDLDEMLGGQTQVGQSGRLAGVTPGLPGGSAAGSQMRTHHDHPPVQTRERAERSAQKP